jgi:DNA (cytosine-5)-methyltransferase 1
VRPPTLRIHADELIVDNFAGAGGASRGIERALGRSPDIAVNHDPEAIAMHKVNHPRTQHLCGDVWDVDPVGVCGGRKVGLLWMSPDCCHFSKAKGGKPRSSKRRALAWVAVRWARTVKPRVIVCENVEEFADWGPLLNDGTPNPLKKGFTFRRWVGSLEAAGYKVEMRELRACDYGAPTIRKRLFIIARCDGQPIVWPKPTHGVGLLSPHRSAAECIVWALPCPSIFERKKALAEKTLRRIARGVQRFVLDAAQPFIVPVTHAGERSSHPIVEPFRTVTAAHRGELALVSPSLIQTGYGERPGQTPRFLDIHRPLGTIVPGGKHALVSAFLAKHYGGHEATGSRLDRSVGTVTARDHHALVTSHMLKLRGTCADGQPITRPFPTVTAGGTHLGEVRAFLTRHKSTGEVGTGLVHIAGEDYAIGDIGMRMLVPRELFRAQGFNDEYIIDRGPDGGSFTKTAQIRLCGNSVSPDVADAIIAANLAEERAAVA